MKTSPIINVIALLLMFNTALFCQNRLNTSIFFGIDKHEIEANDFQKISKLLDSISTKNILQIELYGHTDSRRNEEHNLKLSQRRVQSVKDFLIHKGLDTTLIVVQALGKTSPIASNETEEGRQQNRRTEIVIHYHIPSEEPLEPVDTTTIVKAIITEDTIKEVVVDCSKDTTLVMPNGTLVVFGLCDYLKIKDCFSFQEFISPEAARAAGLTTMSEDGVPLFSAGMFEIKICDDDVCPVILLPFIEGKCSEEPVPCAMTLWNLTANNTWNDTYGRLEIVKVDGKKYYKSKVCGSNKFNGDCESLKTPKIRILKSRVKVEQGYHLVDAKFSYYYSPFVIANGTNLDGNPQKTRQVIKFEFDKNRCPKCNETMIYAKAIAPNGDTLIRNFTVAEPYHKRTAFGICKGEVVKRFLFFFKIRKKAIYKKYILKREDFDVCLPYKPADNEKDIGSK